jgi:cytochrome b involved in lipid metabolism
MKGLILFVFTVLVLAGLSGGFYIYKTGMTPVYGVANSGTMYSFNDVRNNNTPSNCYSSISGKVYNFTEWINKHPGGSAPIKYLVCGKDASVIFGIKHGSDPKAAAALKQFEIGTLVETK